MKIVKPYAKVIDGASLTWALQRIEYAARISHASEDAQTDSSAERFLRAVVLGHGDWSVVEHVSVSVEFRVDRGITHELVRHRIASYTQSSTRFINYVKKMPPTFIYPKPDVTCEHCLAGDEPIYQGEYAYKQLWSHRLNRKNMPSDVLCSYDADWLVGIDAAELSYKKLLDKGWRPQEARSVFPNALSSKILVTMNLRSWRHFLLMRTTKEAHPQMRQVTIPLLAEFQKLVPVLFEDIVPEARQVENIAKGR